MLVESERLLEGEKGALTESRAVYLILYVSDLTVSRHFYEQQLGLRVLEEDEASVKYDAGGAILCLNRAADYGITLVRSRHESADIVFLVSDIDAVRAALEARGVDLGPAFRYEPGGICDFYDPDGHWLTLYEPNDEAMTWPSGEKIRAIQRAMSRIGSESSPVEAARDRAAGTGPMDGSPLVYLFLFVRDPHEALAFYNQDLGLVDLEGGPCSSGNGGDEEGVIKYDGGGFMLTTHKVWESRAPEDLEHPCPPRLLDPTHMNALAVVFHTPHIDPVFDALGRRGVQFDSGITRSSIGRIARFTDPSGHIFYLYEPSAEALGWPSGAKIEAILQASV